ncbi:putative membrane protein [Pedobacter sp. UYEF25]
MVDLQNNNINNKPSSFRYIGGLLVILVGIAFLLNNLNLGLPDWLFDWPIFLVALGIFVGAKKNFRGIGWLVLILIGGYNLLGQVVDLDVSKYALGVGLVILGAFLILRPKSSYGNFGRRRFKNRFDEMSGTSVLNAEEANTNDYFEASAVFGGTHQSVFSKNFKGGKIAAVFGGADINFTQADFTGSVVLEINAAFGGIKLIVPPNWAIKTNISPMFGNVEDKRMTLIETGEEKKLLILDGSVTFGGVEIRSF